MRMKKVFILTCLMLSVALTFAQTTKKVAILEVVDREGRLSYSQKLVLRSNMARAIANTDGYEAYDRSDVDMIMSEQDFQRTGIVSETEIHKLGEMTGVSLILVTEGVLLDADKIFVTAKILNVETGRVDMTDNTTMGLESTAMQQGCNDLARKLFGTGAVSSQASKYYVSALSGHYYSYRGKTLDEKAYMNFLRNNCPEAFAQYNKGRVMTISGWVAFGAGLVMTGVGAGLIIVGNNKAKTAVQPYTEKINAEQAKIDKIETEMDNKYGHVQTVLGAARDWRSTYDYWKMNGYNTTQCKEMENALNQIDAYNAQIKLYEQQRDADPDIASAYSMKNSGTALAVVGPVTTVGSVPLLYFGNKAKKKSIDIYNNNCASSSARPLSLNLISGYNGVGLSVNF
jgi:hypothetical protein